MWGLWEHICVGNLVLFNLTSLSEMLASTVLLLLMFFYVFVYAYVQHLGQLSCF